MTIFTARQPSVSRIQVLFVMVLGIAVLLTIVSVVQDARIDDLEERLTTFETEGVAQALDSG